MKIGILSRTQGKVNRGVESFVEELSSRLKGDDEVVILSGRDSDSFKKMISGGFDILIPTNGRLQSLKASLGRLFAGYKLVIGGHSGIGRDDIFNIFVAKPDVFVALTDYQANWAKRFAWGSRIVKIGNGVDLDKFKPTGRKFSFGLEGKVVLSVGALTWYKFHERAIEAVGMLEDFSLVIVGSGEEENKLNTLGTAELGPGRFKIIKASYEEMPEVYRGADIFTLPSWDRESFGIVYLEAMASNVPVVAPDDLSRKEIVGEGGLLVDVGDSIKYAAAIKEVSDKDWGDKPRKQAEKFSWEKSAAEYQKVFKSLLK